MLQRVIDEKISDIICMGDLNINYMSNEPPNILSVILISEGAINCINI